MFTPVPYRAPLIEFIREPAAPLQCDKEALASEVKAAMLSATQKLLKRLSDHFFEAVNWAELDAQALASIRENTGRLKELRTEKERALREVSNLSWVALVKRIIESSFTEAENECLSEIAAILEREALVDVSEALRVEIEKRKERAAQRLAALFACLRLSLVISHFFNSHKVQAPAAPLFLRVGAFRL
jgi:hypothetical protein